MKPKKSKVNIFRGLKLLVAVSVIFVIAVAIQQANKRTRQQPIETQIQAERQTTVPTGYTGIYDVNGLKKMNNNLSGKYILMQDIDMTGVDWTPIGVTSSVAFKGIFDGNLYKISNLNIDSNLQCVGMFGYTNSSTIKNVTLENITVNGKYNTEINNYACVGGLIGNNSGTVNNIIITGKVSYSGALTNVASNLSIGGIVGTNTNEGRIIDVTNKANVEVFANVYSTRIGGIAGYNIGAIQRAENLGDVSIDTNNSAKVGGLVGYNEYYKPSIGTINNCYSIGNIVASVYNNSSSVGGLIGRNEGTINNCYSAGNIESEALDTGGLVGYRSGGTINNCYWSIETTGQTTSNGGIAKNIQELLYQDTYETWDFDTIWTIEPDGRSLAYLRDRGMPEGILKEDLIHETKVPVTKTDENGRHLLGATFIVKNEVGETLKEGTTDANGVWIISALEPGIYTVVETKAPIGHKKDTKEYTFKLTEEEKIVNVETNEEISIVVKNESLKVDLKVQDSQTKRGLRDVEVGLFDESGNAVIGNNGEQIKGETNENGQVTFTKIPAGNYQYKQLTRAIGYHQNTNTYTFTLTEDGEVAYGEENEGIIYNDPVQANIKVTIYKGGTNKPLQGAVLGLYDEEKQPIIGTDGEHITAVTGPDGVAEFTGVASGNYYYKVLTAPAGYVQDDAIYGVNIDDEGAVEYETGSDTIYNEPIKVNVRIRKYRNGTEMPVPGAVIGLFDEEGNALLGANGEQIKGITDEGGRVDFSDIEMGTYQYQELIAPEGYVRNEGMYSFVVDDKGNVTFGNETGIIYNARVTTPQSFIVTKYKINSTIPLENAVIGLFDGEGNKITEKTTGANGQVDFGKLEVGNYYYQELVAPAGYVLNNTQYHFTVENNGGITVGEGTTRIIYNNPVIMKESFTITKKRVGTEDKLAGAVIGIYNSDNTKIRELTTDKNGIVEVSGLEVGEYYYKELTPPVGYVLNNKDYHFTVQNDGSVTYAEGTTKVIFNERVTTAENFVVTKYRTNTESPLAGAVIGLFDGEGNKITEKTTGTNGQVDFGKLEVGNYYYQEMTEPTGYVLNNTKYHFTVENNGTITYIQGANGIIYNTPVRSNVVITKYREGTTTPLAGATIALYDANGNKLDEKTTGSNGKVLFNNLEVGTYKYQEITPPAGYLLNNTMYQITINNDGSIDYGENNGIIYNEPVRSNVVITKYKTGTTTPLAGAVIGLFDKDGTPMLANGEPIKGATTKEGTLTIINLEPGQYAYQELQAPLGYVRNETMYRFTIANDGSVTFENDTKGIIYNEPIRVDVTITKYKTGTTIPVAEATIALFDKTGNKVDQKVTNANGQITFTNLEAGNYRYQEMQAPAGYVLNSNIYEFSVNVDGSINYGENEGKLYNDPVKADVIITKYKTGTDTTLAGAVIGLFDTEGNKIDEKVTNANGQVTFVGLEVGTYNYRELQAPVGYILNNTVYTFIVNIDGSINYGENNGNLYNDVIKSSAVITKYITGTKEPVKGAVIGLFDEAGNKLDEKTTESNGTVLFEKLEAGTYRYQELQAPAGYILNNTVYTFTVNIDGSVNYGDNNGNLYNDTIKANVIITKRITGTETPLAGATIALFDANGNKLYEKTTNETGTVVFENLEVGTYNYKELQAPVGYELNHNTYIVSVNPDGSVNYAQNEGIIYNDLIKKDVTITKYITGTTIQVKGALIGLFDEAGNKLDEKTTESNGTVTFSGLTKGNYYYQELEAPAGYILNNTIYTFTINADGSIAYGENNGIIYNDVITANVTITKYETNTSIKLAGATIGLFDTAGNKLLEATTNENGTVTFNGLTKGNYYYQELRAPEGYVLNNTKYNLTVDESGAVTYEANNGNLYNDKIVIEEIKGNATILKLETKTNKQLKGAVIALYDANGNKLREKITDENGSVTFTGLKAGTYYYKELQAPTGYVLNDTMYQFTVNGDGSISYAENKGIIYNDKIIVEETKVDVVIIKQDTKTKELLAGAKIGLFDNEGNSITELETNQEGKIVFRELKPGTYQYKELIAPEGYKLKEETYTFTIDEKGKVKFENGEGILYNEKIEGPVKPVEPSKPEEPTKPEPPKDKPTSDNLPNFLPQTGEQMAIVILITIAIGSATYYGMKLYKQKKQ